MQNNTMAKGMTDETAQQMTAYLEDLMNRQIQKLRQYDLEAAMKIAEESQSLSEKILQTSVLSRPGFEEQRDRIQGLYRELCLTIASQRQEVSDKLGQIRTGLRTLGTYAGK
jgi:hypothetical protein